jgi:hypothetical protein
MNEAGRGGFPTEDDGGFTIGRFVWGEFHSSSSNQDMIHDCRMDSVRHLRGPSSQFPNFPISSFPHFLISPFPHFPISPFTRSSNFSSPGFSPSPSPVQAGAHDSLPEMPFFRRNGVYYFVGTEYWYLAGFLQLCTFVPPYFLAHPEEFGGG